MKADLGSLEFSLRPKKILKLVAVGAPKRVYVFSGREQFSWELKGQV